MSKNEAISGAEAILQDVWDSVDDALDKVKASVEALKVLPQPDEDESVVLTVLEFVLATRKMVHKIGCAMEVWGVDVARAKHQLTTPSPGVPRGE